MNGLPHPQPAFQKLSDTSMVARLIHNALRQMMRQPFRTLLILQGVIWGTALGVFPPAILKGTFRKAEWDASAQGTNRIVLALEHLEVAESFSWKDVSWIRENYQAEIDHISGFAMVKPDTKQGQWILATDTAA
ncbi:MAG TPA: hypothetical protein EYG38_01040, partial [Verrucomicrobia bacterium]|nr:hypothetical protein [Verrucomicrobiota bacterium]